MFLDAGALRQMTAELIRHEHLLLADHAKGAAQVQQLQFAVSQAQFASDTLRKDLASHVVLPMPVCLYMPVTIQTLTAKRRFGNICAYAGTA